MRFGDHSEFGRPGRSFFRGLRNMGLFEDKPGTTGGGGGTPDPKDVEIADLKAKLEAATKPKPDPKPDPKPNPSDLDLQQKAKLEREAKDKSSARDRQIESALRFNLGAKDFLKQNEKLLPKEVADIFTAAEKENFSDAIEKDAAIKAGLIQSFFQVQANVDMLTSGQKSQLDDYLKLTKTGKQEKAQYMYDMIFEPAFDTLKRIKKAEALNRGHAPSSGAEDDYKKRLEAHSRQHYLGEKPNA